MKNSIGKRKNLRNKKQDFKKQEIRKEFDEYL